MVTFGLYMQTHTHTPQAHANHCIYTDRLAAPVIVVFTGLGAFHEAAVYMHQNQDSAMHWYCCLFLKNIFGVGNLAQGSKIA